MCLAYSVFIKYSNKGVWIKTCILQEGFTKEMDLKLDLKSAKILIA